MSAMDSEHAWHIPGLTLNEKAVLAFITCKANKREGNVMWWSQKQIAEQIGCSRETVKRVLRVLESRGFISREARHYESTDGGSYRGADFIAVHVPHMLQAAMDAGEASGGGGTQTRGGVSQTPPRVHTDPTVGSVSTEGWGLRDHAEPGNLTQELTREENPGIEPASASPGEGIEDERARQIRALDDLMHRAPSDAERKAS